MISLAAYGISFVLPAVLNPHPTASLGRVEMWGWQAALLSVTYPVALLLAGPSNLGYLAAAAAVAARKYRVAVVCSALALASALYCGIMLPPRADGPIRFGGRLGPGYYAWGAAIALMLVSSVRGAAAARHPSPQTRRGERP